MIKKKITHFILDSIIIKNNIYLPIAKAISAIYILTIFSGKEPHCSTNENNSPPPIKLVTEINEH